MMVSRLSLSVICCLAVLGGVGCALAAAPEPGPGGGCSMATDKKACGKGCLWCEGGFGPGSCYDEAQAKFLPKQFFKCKKPSVAAPAPVTDSCTVSMNRKVCDEEAGCVWCVSDFSPSGKCYEESEAKWLPKEFYRCKPATA